MTTRILALALFFSTGCTVGTTAGFGYEASYPSGAVVYDTAPPVDIELYPRYAYDGGYVYLVGDRWYRPYRGGWGYFDHEPPPLYRYREQRYRSYGHSAPPAYGRAPAYAPPAYGHAPPAYGGHVPARPYVGGGPSHAPTPYAAPVPHPAPPARGRR